jgi:hypothetical protein
MNLKQRIHLLVQLGDYMLSGDPPWQTAKERAHAENGWFIPEFLQMAITNIVDAYLKRDKLEAWVSSYHLQAEVAIPKNVGLIMAGNIPLVGFHDFLSVFVCGHRQTVKPSAKDSALIRHLVEHLHSLEPCTRHLVSFAEMLKGCDAYIATGSNNSSRYFEYYFAKYPHLIRRNRSSAGILTGNETENELAGFTDDLCLYFGLGCRNVSKMYVPRNYDFTPFLTTLSKYVWQLDHHKYRNNYDYQLAVLLLNNKYFMAAGPLLITQNALLNSPISVLNFEYYEHEDDVLSVLKADEGLQCIIGQNQTPFGLAQRPSLADYADGADTLQFLQSF